MNVPSKDGWSKKRRGTALIHTHPDAFEKRAIVENSYGIRFSGDWYGSLPDAKEAALSHPSKTEAQ